MFMVTSESKMAGNDLENNMAFYGAESGMESLTAQLAALYQTTQSPQEGQITALANFTTLSAVPNVTYSNSITFPAAGNSVAGMPCSTVVNGAAPPSCYNTISSGSNQGLYAELAPMNLTVNATRPAGASVNITRTVEVALIPVFQFGVFCGYDCSYFAGPPFSFGGRVHTNSNLFLGSGATLVFNDKVQAYKQIITDRLENGNLTTNGYGGTTYVPNAQGGCSLASPATGTNCFALPTAGTNPGDASWSGGYPGVGGSANANFPSISSGTFNGYLSNSLTGANNLQLPFVQNSCVSNPPPCTDPISIIRKPLAGESPTSTLGSARMYNKAQIRILLADTIQDLHPERGAGALDAQDVEFPNTTGYSVAPFTNAAIPLTAGGTEAMGFAAPGSNGWLSPYVNGAGTAWASVPINGEITTNPTSASAMTGPYIRVEYLNNAGTWVGITQEWLKLGFSRLFDTPSITPGANAVDPNAILILQQLRPTLAAGLAHGGGTGNFYPINFYDAREGEMRDNGGALTSSGGNLYSSCSVNGIMNAVELDVGNLSRWLSGSIAGSGTLVNYTKQNGYVLYFSDHRGMLHDPNSSNGGQTPAGVISGESGIEDVINSSQPLTSSTPDGVLETTSYYSYSPEDVDQNGVLDNWGEVNIGYGFRQSTNTTPPNPYKRIGDCVGFTGALSAASLLTGATDNIGLANSVSGARHVLKLVDGGMSAGLQSYLPVMPAASGCSQSTGANATACGGFTVASENPVYVLGNYNSSGSDPFWTTATATTPTQTPHSAASIIADAVTVLSNQWSDMFSLAYPDNPNSRPPTVPGYYRMAIAGGKNIPFPQPTFASVANDFGTDGGMHNFLRYLEAWGTNSATVQLYYDGSQVSMYYSEYNTGTYKDGPGGDVYSPPPRKYYFDTLFLNPSNLPPGTPMFQDIDNLSYHQNFTPQ
jgi:hypothetical protein